MEKRRTRPLRGFCIFPGYKWCGPGCSGPGAPINDVDACCKEHDYCYRKYGSSCRCDRSFLDCLRPKVNSYSQKGRQAVVMYNYMKLKYRFTCTFFK
ncbi:phospholipase [Bacillus methanolicus]|uniref:phospholipase n=1 Tax=Bacillus methanolicus TaxID=1471 RepID=UPI00200F0C18|nr:phospholipase [Bacillus methanolicus]UQD52194.1 phospholipase [Bacillus methanolicus]